MSPNIQLRQQNLEETEKMAQFESPDGDDICASYVSREVADQLGEYAEVTISDEAEVTANLAKTTANYGVFETPGGAVTGLYINHSVLAEVAGESSEEDAPESIGIAFAPSDEEAFDEADTVDEEEVDGLLAGDGDDSDDEPEEVEISDEELDLVE